MGGRRQATAWIVALGLTLGGCVGPPANQLAQDWGWVPEAEAACPVEPNPDVTGVVRMGWQAVPNGDLIVRQLRWLESCMPNAEIGWQKYDGGADVIQGFESNSVDVVISGSAGPARGLSQPVDIDAVIPYVYDVIGAAESLVVKDPSAESMEDVRGMSIAVPASSTTHYSLLMALAQAGMSAADVNIVFLAPDKMAAGWQSDEIDGAYVWDPTLSELKDQGGTVVVDSSETAAGGAPTYDVALASRQFVEEQPEFMAMWVALQDEATRMIREEPDQAASIAAVPLNLPVEMVRGQFEGYQYPTWQEQVDQDILGTQLAQSLMDTASFLVDQGEVEALSPQEKYFGTPVRIEPAGGGAGGASGEASAGGAQ